MWKRTLSPATWIVPWLLFSWALGAEAQAPAEAPPATQGPARAHPTLLPRVRFEAHGAFTWEGGFGLGARLDLPILRDQVTFNKARDELALSAGTDIIFINLAGENRTEAWPTATVQWALSVNESFTFFPELGITAHIAHDGWDGFYPNIGFGGRYYVYRSVSMVGRLGWPMALSVGVAF